MVSTGSLAATRKQTRTVRAELVEAGADSLQPFGLSLSKPGCSSQARWFGRCACFEGGGRESPGVRVTFFCFAKRKSPKKRRPYRLRPCASLRATCGARSWGGPQNSLRACGAAFKQLRQVSSRCVCPSAHAHPTPCAPRRILKGTQLNIPSGHCCARPRLRSAWRLRPRNGGRAQRWPVWLFGCSAVPPLLAAPAAGRLRGGMRASARMLRELTRRSCLNGAPKARSEFCRAPRKRPAAGLPLRTARGSQTGGRLFFGAFLLAKQKKDTRRRATPGLRPQHRHAIQTSELASCTQVSTSSTRTVGEGTAMTLRAQASTQAQPERHLLSKQ